VGSLPIGPAKAAKAPSPPAAASPPGRPRWLVTLRSHPIFCFALLTPGIPEYLASSSSFLTLATSPLFFFLQIAINVGQYTAGALLVREAVIRWKKGWGTVFLLGLAYGITEEGLGDNTLFTSNHGAEGVLGWFGRYAGVNWVWSTGVLAYHVIFSVGLPILLLSLALPATRGRSLLGRRGIILALVALAGATLTETVLVAAEFHFWMGWPLLCGASIAIAVLVVAAYRAPARLWAPRNPRPTLRGWQVGAIGFAFFPIAFFFEYGFTSTRIPPSALIVVEVAVFAVLLEVVRRGIGTSGNERLLVDLAFGFVLFLAIFRLLVTLPIPVTLPLLALVLVFFFRLRRAYAPEPEKPPVGAAGLAGG